MPHATIDDMLSLYKWECICNGQNITDEMIAGIRPFFQDWETKWMSVYQSLYQVDLAQSVKAVSCPVYFFQGNKDYTANSGLTEQFYRQIKTPKKQLYWFDTGHDIPQRMGNLMQDRILECLQ